MTKLLMLTGLPASGKTTYAMELVATGWKRVNKDDLRAMIDNSKWSGKNESNILKCRDSIIDIYLRGNYNVVVDDTNFGSKHPLHLGELAKAHGATFEVKAFDTPLDECIARDLLRPRSVGEKVIRRFYNQHLRVRAKAPQPVAGPDAVLCDIDGTLAVMGDRSPYDWKAVQKDSVNPTIANMLGCYAAFEIILVSGRDEVCRPETESWLRVNQIEYDQLFMRPKDDNRKDTIVKKEMFEKYIRNNYNVKFVLDDRDQVVDMWRNELGLTCLQVAEGSF